MTCIVKHLLTLTSDFIAHIKTVTALLFVFQECPGRFLGSRITQFPCSDLPWPALDWEWMLPVVQLFPASLRFMTCTRLSDEQSFVLAILAKLIHYHKILQSIMHQEAKKSLQQHHYRLLLSSMPQGMQSQYHTAEGCSNVLPSKGWCFWLKWFTLKKNIFILLKFTPYDKYCMCISVVCSCSLMLLSELYT